MVLGDKSFMAALGLPVEEDELPSWEFPGALDFPSGRQAEVVRFRAGTSWEGGAQILLPSSPSSPVVLTLPAASLLPAGQGPLCTWHLRESLSSGLCSRVRAWFFRALGRHSPDSDSVSARGREQVLCPPASRVSEIVDTAVPVTYLSFHDRR